MTLSLSVDQVISIHREIVCAGTLIHRDKLESAVLSPFQDVFGREVHPSLIAKATKLAEGLSCAQAFLDGNKRVAWLSTNALLALNGLRVCETPAQDAADWILSLNGSEQARHRGALWLNANTVGMI